MPSFDSAPLYNQNTGLSILAADRGQVGLLSGGTLDFALLRVGSVSCPALKPVCFSGSYTDLSGLPTLFSGDYSSLSGLPTLFSGDYSSLSGLPTLFSGDYSSLSGLPTLFSGDYSSLTNAPQPITVADWLAQTSTGSVLAIANKPTHLTDFSTSDFLLPYSKITNAPGGGASTFQKVFDAVQASYDVGNALFQLADSSGQSLFQAATSGAMSLASNMANEANGYVRLGEEGAVMGSGASSLAMNGSSVASSALFEALSGMDIAGQALLDGVESSWASTTNVFWG